MRERGSPVTAVTILTASAPEPADADPHRGWCGATAMVIGGAVAGEAWEFHDTDGTVTHGAELTIDGYDGRVRFFEAATLRDLAAVATALADQLDPAEEAS